MDAQESRMLRTNPDVRMLKHWGVVCYILAGLHLLVALYNMIASIINSSPAVATLGAPVLVIVVVYGLTGKWAINEASNYSRSG